MKSFNDGEQELFEPERYELLEAPAYRFDVGRRSFLRGFGGGLFVGAWLAGRQAKANPSEISSASNGTSRQESLSAWIHIGEDDVIQVYSGRIEMGQGIRTSFAQVIAEELPTPLKNIRLVLGDTALCPYDQGTWGSQSTPRQIPILRRVGAAARQALLDLAAEKWDVPASQLEIQDGQVSDPDFGESIRFGELVAGKELNAMVDDDIDLIDPADWKIAGTPVQKVGSEDFVLGKHIYTSDMQPENLQYGKVQIGRAHV